MTWTRQPGHPAATPAPTLAELSLHGTAFDGLRAHFVRPRRRKPITTAVSNRLRRTVAATTAGISILFVLVGVDATAPASRRQPPACSPTGRDTSPGISHDACPANAPDR